MGTEGRGKGEGEREGEGAKGTGLCVSGGCQGCPGAAPSLTLTASRCGSRECTRAASFWRVGGPCPLRAQRFHGIVLWCLSFEQGHSQVLGVRASSWAPGCS